MPSRYEGFPNALLEAMSCGCATIATNCPSGPAEMIRAGIDGLLVPVDDIDELARTMEQLALDQPRQERLGLSARTVCQRFSLDAVLTQWNDLIDEVTAGRKHARDQKEQHARSKPSRAA
jgi:glycosyltransferase involved in cell wall biosynthesis